jgi:hypothetical protein
MAAKRLHRSEPRRILARLAAVALTLGAACTAHAGALFFYKFTLIADTKGGFPFLGFDNAPVINSDGLMSFHGILTGGNDAVFTSNAFGNYRTVLDTASSPYNFGLGPITSINDSGQVSFMGQGSGTDSTVTTMLRGQGSSATALVDHPFHLFFYQGTQINDRGEVVSLAEREDGGNAVVVWGGPPLLSVIRAVAVDKPNTDMDQALVVGSLSGQPAINNEGMVAFAAVKTDGFSGIFTNDIEGNFTQIVGVDNQFLGFGGAVALNETGGINKVGMVLFEAAQRSGGDALFLWSPSSLTKIADVFAQNAFELGDFTMDFRGQVAYELILDTFNTRAVFRGPHSLFGRVIGPGDVLFGRTVASANITRGSMNLNDQLAVLIFFTDGTQAIARGDPASIFGDIGVNTGVLQATTGTGSSVNVSTPIPTFPGYLTLSFDVTFLSGGGTLEVKLGDSVIKSLASNDIGVRQRVSIPIDLRRGSKTPSPAAERLGRASQLQFVLSGKPGLTAQIGNIRIPGVVAESFQSESLARWHIDKSGGGSAAVVSGGRFPVKIGIESAKGSSRSGAHRVSVTATSAKGLDVTTDIDRSTLRLMGSPVLTKRDASGHDVPDCEARTNRDKVKELVCQFEVKGLSASNRDPTLTLEAATPFGWGITGTNRARLQ